MTKDELMRHFASRGEYSATHHIYLAHPDTLNDMHWINFQGAQAARYIKEAQAVIETMQAYQQLLYERVQLLETAPYHLEVILKREKRYDGKVWYWLTVRKVREVDGVEPETLEQTKYPGTERSKALKDFAAYQKSRPGIIAVKDIEKGKWER